MTRGENDFAHVRFSLRKEMSGEIFVKGRRHWVPEDGSHGCFITERGGSGAGVWKHLSDGQETSPTLITRFLWAGIFIACDLFFSVLHGSPLAFSRLPLILYFLSPTSPFSSPSTSTYADGTELSHSASISHDRPDGRRPKEKKISSVLPAGTDRVYIWSKVLSSSCPFIYLFLFFNSYSNVFVFVLVRCRNDDSIFESLLFFTTFVALGFIKFG